MVDDKIPHWLMVNGNILTNWLMVDCKKPKDWDEHEKNLKSPRPTSTFQSPQTASATVPCIPCFGATDQPMAPGTIHDITGKLQKGHQER